VLDTIDSGVKGSRVLLTADAATRAA
jgi:hypothetical protein